MGDDNINDERGRRFPPIEAGGADGVIPWPAEVLDAASALGRERARRWQNYEKREPAVDVGAPAPFGRYVVVGGLSDEVQGIARIARTGGRDWWGVAAIERLDWFWSTPRYTLLVMVRISFVVVVVVFVVGVCVCVYICTLENKSYLWPDRIVFSRAHIFARVFPCVPCDLGGVSGRNPKARLPNGGVRSLLHRRRRYEVSGRRVLDRSQDARSVYPHHRRAEPGTPGKVRAEGVSRM